MQRNKNLVWSLAVSLGLLVYLGGYATLRLQRSLIRTAQFYNSRMPDHSLAPDAAWQNNDIVRPEGSVGGAWMRLVYWPAIAGERLFWNTIGRQMHDPG